MKRAILFPVCCIVSALLFNSCDEEEDRGYLSLLPLIMNAGSVSFNAYTQDNYNIVLRTTDEQLSMTSADGFVLTGGHYEASFDNGADVLAISLPGTVTESSTYTEWTGAPFSVIFWRTLYVDGYGPYLFDIRDMSDPDYEFTFQVTSLSGGKITATFSGDLSNGNPETSWILSSISNGTLSASIGE